MQKEDIFKVVEDNVNKLNVNTNVQEALLEILREMTKQQMQQIFRPVLNDVEMMIQNKVRFVEARPLPMPPYILYKQDAFLQRKMILPQ